MSRYETLYNNMKNKFTVVNENCEYTLGAYMTMKANEKTQGAALPVAKSQNNAGPLVSVISFISDKLTVKTPPVKDKTIKAFPIRASFSAVLSSIALCTFILSFGIFGAIALGSSSGDSVIASSVEEAPDIEVTLTK